jgi:GGDEF domain-containing protein
VCYVDLDSFKPFNELYGSVLYKKMQCVLSNAEKTGEAAIIVMRRNFKQKSGDCSSKREAGD